MNLARIQLMIMYFMMTSQSRFFIQKNSQSVTATVLTALLAFSFRVVSPNTSPSLSLAASLTPSITTSSPSPLTSSSLQGICTLTSPLIITKNLSAVSPILYISLPLSTSPQCRCLHTSARAFSPLSFNILSKKVKTTQLRIRMQLSRVVRRDTALVRTIVRVRRCRSCGSRCEISWSIVQKAMFWVMRVRMNSDSSNWYDWLFIYAFIYTIQLLVTRGHHPYSASLPAIIILMHQPISEPTTSFSGELQDLPLQATPSTPEPCFFCSEYPVQSPSSSLVNLIPEALFSKYASSQNYFYTKQLNDILQDGFTIGCARYRESLLLDDDEQYLKRQYHQTEYKKKIAMLSQYYKFHKDFPRFYGLPIEVTMGRYYDRKRDFDYKKIRKMLREQKHDLEPSEESDSMVDHSSYVRKSRYSTMLEALKEEDGHDQSHALMDTLNKLDTIVRKRKGEQKEHHGGLKMGVRDDQGERFRFENWIRKAQAKYDTGYTSRHQSKYDSKRKPRLIPTASNTNVRKPPLKMDFRKKKPQEKVQILLPTKRQNIQNKATTTNPKCVYNTNINIEIKNALFCDSTPKPQQVQTSRPDLRKGVIVHQQDFNSLKSTHLTKPFMKNLDLMGDIDWGTSRSKKSKRDKSIQKIYGVKIRSASLAQVEKADSKEKDLQNTNPTHRKSKLTLQKNTRHKTSRSLKTLKSNQYTYNTQRSPNNSLRKAGKEKSQRSLSTSKKSLPKLLSKPAASAQLQNTPKQIMKKYDSTFSTSKQNVDKLLQKKMNVEPKINFQRIRSLV